MDYNLLIHVAAFHGAYGVLGVEFERSFHGSHGLNTPVFK
jgi:hypothetical protein